MPSRSFVPFCACVVAAFAALAGGMFWAAGPQNTAEILADWLWYVPLPLALWGAAIACWWWCGRADRELRQQLRGVVNASRRNELTLAPVAGSAPEFRGWNRLVDALSATQLQEGLQQRLAAAL